MGLEMMMLLKRGDIGIVVNGRKCPDRVMQLEGRVVTIVSAYKEDFEGAWYCAQDTKYRWADYGYSFWADEIAPLGSLGRALWLAGD